MVLLWDRRLSHGKAKYELNRRHPVTRRVLDGTACTPQNVEILLRLIEETIPIPTITIDVSERPDEQREPFEHADTADLVNLGLDLVRAMTSKGATPQEALGRLSAWEPFHRLPHIVQAVCEVIG